MRDEIIEPQEWNLSRHSKVRSSKRPRHVDLSAEVVDAAMEQDPKSAKQTDEDSREAFNPKENSSSMQADIVASLSNQLAILESQREQLQKLLDQAQA